MNLFQSHMRLVIAFVVVLLILAQISSHHFLNRSQDESLLSVSEASDIYDERANQLANTPYVKASDASTITGVPCVSFDQRPLAMMYSGNPHVRQYYGGIAQAGFVVEMAHLAGSGETRVMGIFDCDKPAFVGPMSSGRVDFLNVAASFDAVYVPWGGDSVTRNLLQQGIHNHIDCSNETQPQGSSEACFARPESDIPLREEDRIYGDARLLFLQASEIGYDMDVTSPGFPHRGDVELSERPENGILDVEHMDGFDVTYVYDREFNRYERFFDEEIEYDIGTGQQITPRNIIVLKTEKSVFEVDTDYVEQGLLDPWDGVSPDVQLGEDRLYPNFALGDAWFDLEQEGWAHFYMDGREIIGSWRRDRRDPRAPFIFLDRDGNQIEFVPGQIWMHVLDETRSFSWTEL